MYKNIFEILAAGSGHLARGMILYKDSHCHLSPNRRQFAVFSKDI